MSPVFFGGRLIAGPRRGGWRRVELPDGRRGWLEARAVRPPRERPPALLDRIRSLYGSPYLWGGRTPAGYDCSAFVQQVLREQSVALPRDAHQQYVASRALPRGEIPELGDLVFFSAGGRRMGHVGIGLGGGWFAHCRGSVRVSSLDPHNLLCDKALMPQFRGWRRPRNRPLLPP